jgi:hypothetical protein
MATVVRQQALPPAAQGREAAAAAALA